VIDLTSHCWCVAPWLTFVACPPAFGQDTAPLQTISPRARAAFAQSSPIPSDEQASEAERRISYGVETAFSSGHADRGFIISDRPVVQPVLWLSRSGAEFSLWGNLTLAQTTDRSRPEILEMELTREHEWSKLSVAPAVRMFFYHDALNRDNTRSVEGWLYLSYQAGPVRLFSNHSLDVLTYRGAYFGEAGIEAEGHVAHRVEIGSSFAAGWASSRFNDAYADVAKSALDRISAEGWLTAHVNSRFYIGPHFEFSTIADRAVRAGLIRPTYCLVRLTTGAEF